MPESELQFTLNRTSLGLSEMSVLADAIALTVLRNVSARPATDYVSVQITG